MRFIKLFESFDIHSHRPDASKEDIEDLLNDLSDYYDCYIEVKEEWTSIFFLFGEYSPKIDKYDAISKIIEIKENQLISPKFIRSLVSDHYNFSSENKETKDYHKNFQKSPNYESDAKLIYKYYDSKTFLVQIKFKYSTGGILEYDYDGLLERLKSMYDLDVLYFRKNKLLGGNNMITTILLT